MLIYIAGGRAWAAPSRKMLEGGQVHLLEKHLLANINITFEKYVLNLTASIRLCSVIFYVKMSSKANDFLFAFIFIIHKCTCLDS